MTTPRGEGRFRLGLAVLLAAALVGVGVVLVSSAHVGARSYTAELSHTAGLRAGEEVQVAGVGVGEVTGIELTAPPHRTVRVHFTVDDDIHLGSRTTAEVKVATLLGTHYLMVVPAGAGELDGAIPVSRTRVPFNLQDVIDAAAPELQEFDTGEIQRAMATLADTLDQSRDELGPALDGVRRISAVAARRSDELGELLGAARRVSAQLVDSSGDLVTLMRQADLVLDTLRARRTTIHQLLADLATFGRELAGAVEDTRGDLGPTLRGLGTVIDVLHRHERDLDDAIRDLAPAVRYFANASGTGPYLNQHVPGAMPDNVTCHLEGRC
jgi:phospholipid/cholesterol/gamma-HCH transport system substrate-binding protein